VKRRWSKFKAELRERWAPSVRGELDIHMTTYRAVEFGRLWFTWKGVEIYSFDDLKTHMRTYPLRADLEALGEDFQAASAGAMAAARAEGHDWVSGFGSSADHFLGLKIAEAVISDDPIIRALSMIDRRAGKKTVTSVELERDIHPFVRRLREIRCQAEGWGSPQVTLADAD
jgi:hypothetical protein